MDLSYLSNYTSSNYEIFITQVFDKYKNNFFPHFLITKAEVPNSPLGAIKTGMVFFFKKTFRGLVL